MKSIKNLLCVVLIGIAGTVGIANSVNAAEPVLNYWLNVYEIDTKHFVAFGSVAKEKNKRNSFKLNDILSGNYPLYGGSRLKDRLINEHVLEHVCSVCNLTDWRGKPIPLDLDHINGIPTDHRLENLRLICRNCHAQTENFCGRNKTIYGSSKKSKKSEKWLDNKRKIQERDDIIKNIVNTCDVDFSKNGWVVKLSKLTGLRHQKVSLWMKSRMSKFYEENCFKRRIMVNNGGE